MGLLGHTIFIYFIYENLLFTHSMVGKTVLEMMPIDVANTAVVIYVMLVMCTFLQMLENEKKQFLSVLFFDVLLALLKLLLLEMREDYIYF